MEEILDYSDDKILKSKYLLTVGWYCGLIPLVVGWLIFFLWAVVHGTGLGEGEFLMISGFYWIFVGIMIAVAGLLSIFLYAVENRNNLHNEIWYAIGLILLNIPCVFLIIYLVMILSSL